MNHNFSDKHMEKQDEAKMRPKIEIQKYIAYLRLKLKY
jgi:hypothetical protein